MAAVLRIGRKPVDANGRLTMDAKKGEGPAPDIGKEYIDRLVKLIPSEVVGLYIAGKGVIQAKFDPAITPPPAGEDWYWIGWTLVCFLAVILSRAWATRDPETGTPPQWGAVAIAALSFVFWIYTLGDIFSRVTPHYWSPVIGTLTVMVWTFLVPFFYKGDEAEKKKP